MEYSLKQKKKECGPPNSFDLSSTDLQDNKLKLQETTNTQKIMIFTENDIRDGVVLLRIYKFKTSIS